MCKEVLSELRKSIHFNLTPSNKVNRKISFNTPEGKDRDFRSLVKRIQDKRKRVR